MTFRPLTPEEVPLMVPLGRAFFEEAGLPGTFDEGSFRPAWQNLLRSGIAEVTGAWEGALLVGVAGFLVSPDLNTGDIIAVESFFFVQTDCRGRGFALLDAAEQSIKARGGVKRILMIHLSGRTAEMLGRAYRRRGYAPLEHVYVKSLV